MPSNTGVEENSEGPDRNESNVFASDLVVEVD